MRIISDYQTMFVLSSLSNKVSLSERRYLPSEMSEPGREQMYYIKEAVLGASDGCSAYDAARSLKGSESPRERRYLESLGAESEEPDYYIVWTSKTFVWEREAGISPRGGATGDVYPTMVEPFLDSRFFQLEAALSNQAYVFRVLPAPVKAPPASADPSAPLLSEVLGVRVPPGERCTWTP